MKIDRKLHSIVTAKLAERLAVGDSALEESASRTRVRRTARRLEHGDLGVSEYAAWLAVRGHAVDEGSRPMAFRRDLYSRAHWRAVVAAYRSGTIL